MPHMQGVGGGRLASVKVHDVRHTLLPQRVRYAQHGWPQPHSNTVPSGRMQQCRQIAESQGYMHARLQRLAVVALPGDEGSFGCAQWQPGVQCVSASGSGRMGGARYARYIKEVAPGNKKALAAAAALAAAMHHSAPCAREAKDCR